MAVSFFLKETPSQLPEGISMGSSVIESDTELELDETELDRLAVEEALDHYAIEEELCAINLALAGLRRDPGNLRLRQLTVASIRELSDIVATPLAQEPVPPRKPR